MCKIAKSDLIPVCENFQEACDQISRLGTGVPQDNSLESQINLNAISRTFYANRGHKLEKDLELVKKNKSVNFERNDDVFELTLFNQKDPKQFFVLSLHITQKCELDSARLSEILRENGLKFEESS